MTIARLAATAALLLGAGRAAAFNRTSDSCTGVCLQWSGARQVTYVVNAAQPAGASPTCVGAGGGDPALAAIEAGFGAWSGAGGCTDLSLVYGGPSSITRVGDDGTNLVLFRRGWCAQVLGASDPCWSDHTCGNAHDCFEDYAATDRQIIALTTTTYDRRTGALIDADIELAGWDGTGAGTALTIPKDGGPAAGWYFTCLAPPGARCGSYGQQACYYMDLQNTITHEAGHFIGLAHNPARRGDPVPSPAPTMAPTSAPGDFAKRDLAPDDVQGVCTIYPSAAPTQACPYRDVCSGASGCGCGTAPAGGAAALLGLLALAPRRRRSR